MRKCASFAVAFVLFSSGGFNSAGAGLAGAQAEAPEIAVGAQYDSTHVYVTPEDFDRFVASFLAIFGGSASKPAVVTVTPTPSSTLSQFVMTPAGAVSVFGYKTPAPWPFGAERTGYLVTDMDRAVAAARAAGAEIIVTPFADAIGRDAIIQWPGGVEMQLYWHNTPPSSAPLRTVPENRVYLSADRADEFVRCFVGFSHGTIVSDNAAAPGVEIGRPDQVYRRIRIESAFGKMAVLVTDGHLPYPYGREITGYEAPNLAETLAKAQSAGATVLVPPFTADGRDAAMVRFPGGYIAEIHSALGQKE